MSGYFKSLVKQSGVNIGARNSSARRAASRRVAPDPVTPLHVETVAMVGPTTGEVDRVEGKPALTKPAYEVSEPLTPRDPIAVKATTNTPTVNSNYPIEARSETTALDQVGPSIVHETSVAPETSPAETIPEVSINEVIESRKTTPGVIRVGEPRNDIDQQPVIEPDVRALDRSEFSIPPDYLDGIREWLTAPPTKSDEIITERTTEQHDDNDPIAPKQRSPRPVIELDLPSHDELQEFSLSIGSISIVVEEPARQPQPPITNMQPVEPAPVSAQPRANDAFALSRNYFRGF